MALNVEIPDKSHLKTAFSSKQSQNEGKYMDRTPHIVPAGVQKYNFDGSVANCLHHPEARSLPEPISKLHSWVNPDVEQHRIFHGIVNDPQLIRAREMIHGIHFPSGVGIGEVLNPRPKTIYQQRYHDKLESIYHSHRRPLGRVPDSDGRLPADLDIRETRFGIRSAFGDSVGELVNPEVSRGDLWRREQADHDQYLKTHYHVYPGEQALRGYKGGFDPTLRYGMPTPHDVAGRQTRRCLHWVTDQKAAKQTPMVAKRLDDFREKFQPQIGLPLDPIKETMKVGPNHIFGMPNFPDPCTVSDLLQGRVPKHIIVGPNRWSSVVAAFRRGLRETNYNRYPDVKEALRQRADHLSAGDLLPESEVRRVCELLDIPVDSDLLEQVFDLHRVHLEPKEGCVGGKESMIDWRQFTECFHWRDRRDYTGVLAQRNCCRGSVSPNCEAERGTGTENRPPYPHQPHWSTTNSLYSAGAMLDARTLPAFGVPSARRDLPIPKVRKATDKTNYGDDGGAMMVVNPSILTMHGLSEIDMRLPRSKDEIKQLFISSGAELSDEVFEQLWSRALDYTSDGRINLEIMRYLVNDYEEMKIRAKVDDEFKRDMN